MALKFVKVVDEGKEPHKKLSDEVKMRVSQAVVGRRLGTVIRREPNFYNDLQWETIRSFHKKSSEEGLVPSNDESQTSTTI